MLNDIELKQLSTFVLSPGNIFWKKANGTELLLSAKNGLLNIEMISKLQKAGHHLEIKEQINFKIIDNFKLLFNEYKSTELLGDKIKITNQILSLMNSYLIQVNPKQSDLNHLCLILFSEIPQSKLINYVNMDFEYFVRSQNIASSFVIISFILGYYDLMFLKHMFNDTIEDLMAIRQHVPGYFLTDSMTKFQKELTPPDNSLATLLNIKNSISLKNLFIFERLDGKGLSNISANEMNNLEIIFCNLCYHYDFENNVTISNIIDQVIKAEFHLNKPLRNEIMNNLGVNHD